MALAAHRKKNRRRGIDSQLTANQSWIIIIQKICTQQQSRVCGGNSVPRSPREPFIKGRLDDDVVAARGPGRMRICFAQGAITISMRRRAIAEFQTTLTAANAPLDKFARGDNRAMTTAQKRGAVVFFTRANCVACHAVAGRANEMFSDFQAHRIGGPQLAPVFGVGTGNTIFDGPGENEDFGFEQTEGNPQLRYMFRTAPLRNLKVSPALFHNGAFRTIEAAIEHHLDVFASLRRYEPRANGVPADLREGPHRGILKAGIDPVLQPGIRLTKREIDDLVEFVRDGLFDERVLSFCQLLPRRVPSGLPLQRFEGCEHTSAHSR